jgi:hypothetical protein
VAVKKFLVKKLNSKQDSIIIGERIIFLGETFVGVCIKKKKKKLEYIYIYAYIVWIIGGWFDI